MSPDPTRQERLDRIAETAARVIVGLLALEVMFSLVAPPVFSLMGLPAPDHIDLGVFGTMAGLLLGLLGRGSIVRLIGRK